MPWFRTLPPGREYAFKNRLLPCSSGTLEWIMFSFAWTGNAAGAKDAMCSAFAKRLWLGVLLVTITSARPTLQGTELKKKWNPKCDSMWWNFCDFCLPLTRYTWFIYLMLWSICVTIWTPTSTNCITDQLLLLLTSLMKPRVLCRCSLFSSLFTYFIFTFIQVLFNKYVIVLFLHDIVCKYLLTKWFFFSTTESGKECNWYCELYLVHR